MEKNLLIPTAMVLGFVAVLTALFAGPLTEDDVPVIDACIGDHMQFEYAIALGASIGISSDHGIDVDQRRLRPMEGFEDKAAFEVDLIVHKYGSHMAYIVDADGATSAFFKIKVNKTRAWMPADGRRDISSELAGFEPFQMTIASPATYVLDEYRKTETPPEIVK